MEYGYRIDQYQIRENETIEFANWLNPLIKPKELNKKEIDFFRKYIPEGSFAIDIGAHIGDTSLPMGLAAGARGLVLALDPNPQIFKILEVNASLNPGKTNILPLRLAVSDQEKEFYFASSEASMSNGGLIEDLNDNRHGRFKIKEPVRVVNITNYINEHFSFWLEKLSLIKIDTEGLDYFILKTLLPILEKYRPTIIMEIFHDLSDQTRSDIYSLLKSFNYSLLNIGDFETNIDYTIKPVRSAKEMPKKGQTENIIAFFDSVD
jgi:FkbM family methyltransferase